jgi:methyl-accepting chemotaxis protein
LWQAQTRWAAASRETAQASSQVSASIDELASAMAEMSANVKNVSKNTQMQAGSGSDPNGE